MVGLGETEEEVLAVLEDLRAVGCDVPTHRAVPAAERAPSAGRALGRSGRVRPLQAAAVRIGFPHVESGPLVRSSYHAERAAARPASPSGSEAAGKTDRFRLAQRLGFPKKPLDNANARSVLSLSNPERNRAVMPAHCCPPDARRSARGPVHPAKAGAPAAGSRSCPRERACRCLSEEARVRPDQPAARDPRASSCSRSHGKGDSLPTARSAPTSELTSPATVSQHLEALASKGALKRQGRHYSPADSLRFDRGVPVVGRVAAGHPDHGGREHRGPYPLGPDRRRAKLRRPRRG